MSKKKFVILGPNHPIPLRALWLVLDSHHVPSDEDGFALPGNEDTLRAHQVVARWFAEVNGPEDLSFLEKGTPIELHRDQAGIGVCPFCFQNDGHQDEAEGEFWGFCTLHRTRWPVEASKIGYMAFASPPRPIGDFSVVEGVELPSADRATGTTELRVVKSERSQEEGSRNRRTSPDGVADPGVTGEDDLFEAVTEGEMYGRMFRKVGRSLVQFAKDVVLLFVLPFLFLVEWVIEFRDAHRRRPRRVVRKSTASPKAAPPLPGFEMR